MKKQNLTFLVGLIVFVFLVSACNGGAPLQPSPTVEAVASSTSTPLPEPTSTPTQPGINVAATVAAMAAQVTLVPPTPVGGVDSKDIASDDYVGIFKQAWAIVEANYVRDNFNGVDWDAVYDEYLPKAEQVQSTDELHVLLADLIRELGDDHSRFVPPSRMQAVFGVETSDSTAPRPWSGINMWPPSGHPEPYLHAWYVCNIGPAAFAGI